MNAPAPSAAAAPDFEVLIVGTGFAGLAMAIRLQQAGIASFALIERAASVGGTWRDNHYPGAACDVPSHLYSFSFAQNPDWSRRYPTQPELQRYLQGIAERYALLPHIRFGHELLAADYDEAAQLWRVRTGNRMFSARVLVSGTGALAEPRLPDIPGVERFRGKTFHSACWDHAYDLAGQRVAVIGTGASAIQLVPEIAPKAARLDLYQRTPNWIIPRPDRAITRVEKFLLRHVKPLQWLYRALIYWGHEARVMGFVIHPWLMTIFQKIGERHLERAVKDPALRAKLTPDYTIGCKRILISNDWYPALQRPNVKLVTEGIREIRDHAVVSADGTVREVDAIVHATGFYATDNPIAGRIRGRGGQALAEAWRNGEEAYLGTLVHGFPNLFLIVGPNTGLGHSSMVFMIETQVAYVMKCLGLARRTRARAIEVRREVQDGFNRRLQERLRHSVWATGCRSWYQHKSGKITALWPGFTFGFWWRARKFRATDYTLSAALTSTQGQSA